MGKMSLQQAETMSIQVGVPVETADKYAAELARVKGETEKERLWWGEKYLLNLDDGFAALKSGDLKTVEYGIAGRNYDLIRMPEMTFPNCGQVNLLRPEAVTLLENIMSRMKKLRPEIIFPITALWRTESAQEMVKEHYSFWAALPRESTHHSGAAFDISLRSYWHLDNEGRKLGINSWYPKIVEFDTKVSETLIDVVKQIKNEGAQLNYVVERIESDNQLLPAVLHVCAGPNIV